MADGYEQIMKNAKGVSREEAFSNFLTNEALHDVSLKGNDGVIVKANRWALAARSEMFEKMLLGRFKETTESEIQLGFKGSVLQAVVEFVYTDKATILDLHDETDKGILQEDFKRMHSVLSLLEAASYFDLPCLYQAVHHRVSYWMKEIPSLSFAVLEACTENGVFAPPDWKDRALSTICSDPICVEEKEGIMLLGVGAVGEILQYKDSIMDESRFFQILEIWAEGPDLTPNDETDDAGADDDLSKHLQDRKPLASQVLTKHIALEKIDPIYLSSKVAPSGLVTKDHLLEAYKSQALTFRSEKDNFYKMPRIAPVWKHSMSDIFAPTDASNSDTVLRYPPMVSGIYQWTLKIKGTSHNDWLGIYYSKQSLFDEIPESYFDDREGFWMFEGNNGVRYENGKYNGDIAPIGFKKGSKVTITLDLLPNEEGNGTLSACVDDGCRINLFTGLRDYLDGDDDTGGGFRPAICASLCAKIRLVKINRL